MKYLITLILINFSITIYAQETIDLFIWAGQSNALGKKGDAAAYPTDPNNLDEQIRFNWSIGNGRNSGGWTTMQPQDGYFSNGHFGAEVTFSRKLQQQGYNTAIFKFSQGATSIYNHWLNPGDGGLYDDMISDLNTAITTLENQGHTVNIKGFVWIQGESDSNSQPAASAYFNNLTMLISDLRNNVTNNPSLPIILGVDEQYFNLRNHKQSEILNAHQDIALNDANIKFTSMYGYPKADYTHLTPAGLIHQGEDIFKTYQLLLSKQQPKEDCILVSTGTKVSQERIAWGQSFTTDCSGTLESIRFSAASALNNSATFTLYNSADCSGTPLFTKTLNSIVTGNNTISTNNDLYLEKEHTYYMQIASDDANMPWRINYSTTDTVFGMLRSFKSSSNCGQSSPSFDMVFSIILGNRAQCLDLANVYNFTYDNRTYQIVKEKKNWAEAAACALEQGGTLARINTAAEQAALWNELHNNAGIILANTVASNGGGASYVWIGGNDIAAEGTWIWNDGTGDQFWNGATGGTSVGGLYSNWGNEPDNAGNQDGLAIALTQWPIGSGSLGAASQWNDLKTFDPLYYVIEYPTVLSDNAIETYDNITGIQIFPNPVTDILTIRTKHFIRSIVIFNTQGQIIKELPVKKHLDTADIDFSTIKKGVYFLNVIFNNGTATIKKVIK